VRLAIDSKADALQPAIVSPIIERREDGLLHLKAAVKVEGLHGCQRVRVKSLQRELADQGGGSDGVAEINVDTVVTADMIGDDGALFLEARVQDYDDTNGECRPRDSEKQTVNVHLPVLPLSSAPVIGTKWADSTHVDVSIASSHERVPTSVVVEVVGRHVFECSVLAFSIAPVSGAGDVAAALPVEVPAQFDEVEVRASFVNKLPQAVPGRDDCSNLPSPLSSVVVLRRPLPDPPSGPPTTRLG
jgi:hypothetical protein